MNTHTKGPWKFDGCYIVANGVVVGEIKTSRMDAIYVDRPEVESNGQLMSAAPALLEALTAASMHLSPDVPAEVREQIRLALEKAGGAR